MFVFLQTALPSLALEPQPIVFGVLDITPILNLNAAHNDNLFLSDQNSANSTIWRVSPSVEAVMQGDVNSLTLQAEVNKGWVADSPVDDYTDWGFGAGAEFELNTRNILNLDVGFLSTHEERGQGFSEGNNLPAEPNEFNDLSYQVAYQFGAANSRGRLSMDLAYDDRTYISVQSANVVDFQRYTLSTTLSLRLLTRSSFLFRHLHQDLNYDLGPVLTSNLINTKENYLFIGMDFAATETITGSVLVGAGRIDYDDPLVESTSSPSWDVGLQWNPLSYTTFSLDASSNYTQATTTGIAVQSRSYELGWEHQWSDRFTSGLSVGRGDDDYEGSPRNDNSETVNIDFLYAFDRWLDINFSIANQDQNSNITVFDFSQTVVSIGIAASL